MNAPIYAIGDIHGELGLLKDALAKIEQDGGSEARIVFLGDYVDRGPDSRGVIELLMNGLAAGRNWVCLLGNHDQMFSMFMEDYPRSPVRMKLGYHWLHDRIGGKTTLASYGVDVDDSDIVLNIHHNARAAVPRAHIDFLHSLPWSHQENDLMFVHAGIRPGVPFEEQDREDFLWIRGDFTNDPRPHPSLIVHGHVTLPSAQHYGNHVNLDSGAGYGKSLTAAVFEEGNCWVLTEDGRVPLLPQPQC